MFLSYMFPKVVSTKQTHYSDRYFTNIALKDKCSVYIRGLKTSIPTLVRIVRRVDIYSWHLRIWVSFYIFNWQTSWLLTSFCPSKTFFQYWSRFLYGTPLKWVKSRKPKSPSLTLLVSRLYTPPLWSFLPVSTSIGL